MVDCGDNILRADRCARHLHEEVHDLQKEISNHEAKIAKCRARIAHLNMCPTCLLTKSVKCPCGLPECTLSTPVPFCPDCERPKLDKWSKMNGTSVCEAYVKRVSR